MKEIGGFFELELNQGVELHNSALRLNLGRTSFEYILRAKKVKKVYLPYYTCDVMLEPLRKLSIKYEFYHINKNLEPVFNYNIIKGHEFFLYNNYFGLKDGFIKEISNIVRNLIIDNAQAFFSKPLPGIDTFYSPRKFFGLPDGGYLYTGKNLDIELEIDKSSERVGHLIGRIEDTADTFFGIFKENDKKLNGQSIKKMSNITYRLLLNIDYKKIAAIRKNNFKFLHNKLSKKNFLTIDFDSDCVPMVYPFFIEDSSLRDLLIKNKIYTACYWPNIKKWVAKDSIEYKFCNEIIPLPIDQRYNLDDMSTIIKLIYSKYGI